MRTALVILILISIFLNGISSVFYYVDFRVNSEYYKKNCINKAKPQLHCNGHCQLMKKIKLEESKDKQNSERKYNYKSEIVSSKNSFVSIKTLLISFAISYPLNDLKATVDYSKKLYRPPSLV